MLESDPATFGSGLLAPCVRLWIRSSLRVVGVATVDPFRIILDFKTFISILVISTPAINFRQLREGANIQKYDLNSEMKFLVEHEINRFIKS